MITKMRNWMKNKINRKKNKITSEMKYEALLRFMAEWVLPTMQMRQECLRQDVGEARNTNTGGQGD